MLIYPVRGRAVPAPRLAHRDAGWRESGHPARRVGESGGESGGGSAQAPVIRNRQSRSTCTPRCTQHGRHTHAKCALRTRPIPSRSPPMRLSSSPIIFQTSVTHLPCTAHGRRMNHMQPANRAHPRRQHGGAPHRGRPDGVFHARQRAAAKDIRTRHSHRRSRLHSHRHLGVENISRLWHSSACRRGSPEAIGLNSGQPFRMWSRPTKQTQQSGPRWRAQHEPGETGYRPCATQSHSR